MIATMDFGFGGGEVGVRRDGDQVSIFISNLESRMAVYFPIEKIPDLIRDFQTIEAERQAASSPGIEKTDHCGVGKAG